ncbi:MAG: aminotransferase class III-fold pyridoxal phosphate-dependent enzyme [Chloroflexaceae bacterium]|nr:aminotransferase class III-fold pyridoxal phosphate-dependent enzyme [Chloroflexaceae bacterium]
MSTLSPTQQHALAEHVWLHFSQMAKFQRPDANPRILVRGEGSHVWDQDGNEYIDALAGLFTVNAGYGRTEIVEAMAAQLHQIGYVSPFSFPSVPVIDLAAKLATIAPTGAGSRSFFVNSGSEAVETALKMAKSYHVRRGEPQRTKVIARRVAYHGTTMGALSVNGVTPYRTGFGPLVPGARHVPPPYRYRCASCMLQSACSNKCANEFEAMIEFEDPSTVAAVIMEPVQNSGGALVSPPDYLRRVREICDHYGVVMILDEVINGFGRVGGWFGSSELGAQPDIITVAKAITNGYAPLGAAIAAKHIADTFLGDEADMFMHGSTFGGHVASAAAALANIRIIEREGLHERARVVGPQIMQSLRETIGSHPNVGDIRGMGMFIAIELVRDKATRESLAGEENLMYWLSDQLVQRGVLCRSDDRMEPVIQIAPPLNMPQEDIDQVVQTIGEVVHVLGRKLGSTPQQHSVTRRPVSPAAVTTLEIAA